MYEIILLLDDSMEAIDIAEQIVFRLRYIELVKKISIEDIVKEMGIYLEDGEE